MNNQLATGMLCGAAFLLWLLVRLCARSMNLLLWRRALRKKVGSSVEDIFVHPRTRDFVMPLLAWVGGTGSVAGLAIIVMGHNTIGILVILYTAFLVFLSLPLFGAGKEGPGQHAERLAAIARLNRLIAQSQDDRSPAGLYRRYWRAGHLTECIWRSGDDPDQSGERAAADLAYVLEHSQSDRFLTRKARSLLRQLTDLRG